MSSPFNTEPVSESDKSRILRRIRKMLTLANDAAASEGERDNAMRMAHATLAKYNLDLADAEAASPHRPDQDPRMIVKRCFYGRPWARRVVVAISEMLFCRNLYTPAARATDTTHWFIGRESNATTAAELSEFIVKSVWSEGHRRARELGLGNEYARNFATGASIRIAERCRELRKNQSQTAGPPGTALVLASLYDREDSANQQYLEATKVVTRQVKDRAKEVRNHHAFASGEQYGSTISLNRQIKG